MKIKSYTRTKIPPGVRIPWGQVNLSYTAHALSRMTEMRSPGSMNILPNMILISEKNLKQIWTVEETGVEKLRSMKVDIPYTRGILLQLIISSELVVITLYFRKVWQKIPVVSVESPASQNCAGDISPEHPSKEDRLSRILELPKVSQFQSLMMPKIAS